MDLQLPRKQIIHVVKQWDRKTGGLDVLDQPSYEKKFFLRKKLNQEMSLKQHSQDRGCNIPCKLATLVQLFLLIATPVGILRPNLPLWIMPKLLPQKFAIITWWSTTLAYHKEVSVPKLNDSGNYMTFSSATPQKMQKDSRRTRTTSKELRWTEMNLDELKMNLDDLSQKDTIWQKDSKIKRK